MKVKEQNEKVGFKAQHSENEDHGTWSHHFMGNRWGTSGKCQTLFLGAPKSLQMVTAAMKLRHLLLGRKVTTNLHSILKSRDYFAKRGPASQSYGFSRSHVWMWDLDYKESWVPKNWFFWTVVLEKTLGVPWTARRSNQSILKEISPGYSLEGLMMKLKLQHFGHLMWRADSFENLDAGKDWGQEEKGSTEDEMLGWHHRLYAHEFE